MNYPLHPFVFVGCWNHEDPYGAREAVASAIGASGAPTVILGGDNIYAPTLVDLVTKEKRKSKQYSKPAFIRGAALYSHVPHLFVAVGNHNIDFASFDILSTERETFGPNAMPAAVTYFKRTFSDGYSIVVIDTNLTEPSEEDKFDDMLRWLRTASIGRYYLIQHEPIVSFKKIKDGKMKYHTLPRASELLNALTEPPIAILCSDTHNYQMGMIERPKRAAIPQYVVGTGGAEYDPITATADSTYSPTGTDITYKFMEHTAGYGYLLVPEAGVYDFKFVKAWQGGGSQNRAKTRRRTRRSKRTKSRHRVRGQ